MLPSRSGIQPKQSVKHQIHYESLEEVSKNTYNKQFTTVTARKNVQKCYNEKRTYNVKTHCNLLRPTFFCLIKFIFNKVRCLINVNISLEANLEGQVSLQFL